MLRRCCGLRSLRSTKINILEEKEVGGGGLVSKTQEDRILLRSVPALLSLISSFSLYHNYFRDFLVTASKELSHSSIDFFAMAEES